MDMHFNEFSPLFSWPEVSKNLFQNFQVLDVRPHESMGAIRSSFSIEVRAMFVVCNGPTLFTSFCCISEDSCLWSFKNGRISSLVCFYSSCHVRWFLHEIYSLIRGCFSLIFPIHSCACERADCLCYFNLRFYQGTSSMNAKEKAAIFFWKSLCVLSWQTYRLIPCSFFDSDRKRVAKRCLLLWWHCAQISMPMRSENTGDRHSVLSCWTAWPT